MRRLLLIAAACASAACNRGPDPRDARIRQLEDEVRALRAQPVPPPAAPAAAAAPATIIKRETIRVPDTATVQQVRSALADANRQIAEMEARADRAGAAQQEAQAETRRYQASLEEAKQKLAAAEQALDSSQRDARASYDRIALLEKQAQQMRQQSGGQQTQALDAERRLRDLDDLSRRREATLVSLMRRYRELSDLYRAASGTVDDRRVLGAQSVHTVDQPRINDTIAAAEEDLRQLRALNVRASQLLAAK